MKSELGKSLAADAPTVRAGDRQAIRSDSPTSSLPGEMLPPVAGKDDRFLPGTVLAGRYRIVSVLGRGGMGEVFRADDLKLEVPVALKFLPAALAADQERLSLLLNEVRLARQISHPHVCRVFDLGEVRGLHFISMEYIDGEDLAVLQRRIGRLPPEKAVEVARGICDGLEAVHDQGILHRDLKPANLMIDDRGRIRITDFGLAATAESVRGDAVRRGTPAYMAPEVYAGGEPSVQSDLYALGLVLYELFTGRPAYVADTREELARLHREAPPPSRLVDDLDPDLEQVILRCLAKDPRARPASAQAVAAGLPGHRAPTTGTVLQTLLASALVDSVRLVERLGDSAAAELFADHERLTRDLLAEHGGREIETTGSGFLLLFVRPIHAVLFAQAYHQALRELAPSAGSELTARVGIHLGEVILRRSSSQDDAGAPRPLLAEGLARAMVTRLGSLAGGRQTLLTRTAFDVARRSAVGEFAGAGSLRWLAHGKYLLAELDEPIEVFEVGPEGLAPLAPPASSEGATRVPGEEVVLGWRPAPGQTLPRRAHWTVERKLGAGGFGEVWLAAHRTTGERRVFKFCYEASRLRALRREITLFRLLREELGERDDIARILDWNFEEAPFFIESEYTAGGNLGEWAEEQGGLESIPLAERLDLVAQVAEALAAAHSVGVLHKDVKPSNVLIYRDAEGRPRARLTDFGVGTLIEPRRLLAAGITMMGLTEMAPGTAATQGGTRLYTAPEILEGRVATVQTDVYALGIVLYQVVVGDFTRTLAPGWRRDVADELLCEDVAAAVDGAPERRLGDARLLAQRLRTLDERHQRRAAEARRREEIERAREALDRHLRRRRIVAVILGAALVFAAAMGLLARRIAEEAERANDMARVAVVGEWLERDPTRAAAVLLEVVHPERIPRATARMREVLAYPLAALELRHQGRTTAVAWSPDGRGLLTAALDGGARIWDLADGTGRPRAGLRLVLRPGAQIRAAAWTGDGRRIAAACSDGAVRVWNVAGQGETLVLKGQGGNVRRISWSPDGHRVATASDDGAARIWNLDDAGEPVVLRGHEGPVTGVSFDPGGPRIATASADHTVRIWSLGGDQLAVLRGHQGLVFSATFSPRGERILSYSSDRTARIWNLDDEGEPIVLRGHRGPLYAAAWNGDGRRVATASDDATARIWNLDGGGEPIILAGHAASVSNLAWSPDGRRVATASFDGTARVWSADEPGRPMVLRGHDAPLVAVAFDPRGERLVTAAWANAVRVWRLTQRGGPTVLTGHEGWVYSARFDPWGERVATAADDGTVRIWDLDRASEPVVLRGHEATVYAVAWSPDGQRLASGSRDGTARIWDLAGGGEPAVLRGHARPIQSVAWTGDGGRLATASYDGTARIWDVAGPAWGSGGEALVLRGHSGYLYSVAWSPDGQRLVTASEDGTARIWNATTAAAEIFQRHEAGLLVAVWSPDGEQILTGAADGTAWIHRVDGQRAPLVLSGHACPVLQATWSPDGSLLATASWDGTVRVWPADGRGAPILLSGHKGPVSGVAFSPDGQRLVTSSADHTARIWRYRLGLPDLLATIRDTTAVCLLPEFRENTLGEPLAEARRAYAECERDHGEVGSAIAQILGTWVQ